MEKSFSPDPQGSKFIAFFFSLCGLGYVLVSLSKGTFFSLTSFFIGYYGLVILLYFTYSKGTYISINKDKNIIQGKAFFIFGHSTEISSITKIDTRDTFGGVMTEVFMTCQKSNNTYFERSLVTVQMLKKNDVVELINSIYLVNKNINLSDSVKKLLMIGNKS